MSEIKKRLETKAELLKKLQEYNEKNVKMVRIQHWVCLECESEHTEIFSNIKDGFTATNCQQCECDNTVKLIDIIVPVATFVKWRNELAIIEGKRMEI